MMSKANDETKGWSKDAVVPNSERIKRVEDDLTQIVSLLDKEAADRYVDKFLELKKKFLAETAMLEEHEWTPESSRILGEVHILDLECMVEAELITREEADEKIKLIKDTML